MELLIIKTGTKYLRIKSDKILEVNLDKASVFPLDRLGDVRDLEKKAVNQGYKNVRIKKLVLSEEAL